MRIRILAATTTAAAALLAGVPATAAAAQPSVSAAAAACSIHWKNSGGYSGFTADYSWAWNTVVGQGATGNSVREIQCLVNNHVSYNGPDLAVDGDYGTATKNAVRTLQANWNRDVSPISVDGVVGPQTWRVLRSA
ncbi:peptidoglycan-binding protein [Streptomyces sp. NBC_00335]|uniref:peptidoglycan-binding domain-containing protein n=1 Tax=unclassified Streptomyces TaxID=2593676 RepID=UPI00225314CF|nr:MULTISPECIES: peptidoglycan-binding domain-containing protein [unclassified Streptomyces]MCX5409819.1 peptidoglycan-binding protein [Streptomyces sp. NBC_00086]